MKEMTQYFVLFTADKSNPVQHPSRAAKPPNPNTHPPPGHLVLGRTERKIELTRLYLVLFSYLKLKSVLKSVLIFTVTPK